MQRPFGLAAPRCVEEQVADWEPAEVERVMVLLDRRMATKSGKFGTNSIAGKNTWEFRVVEVVCRKDGRRFTMRESIKSGCSGKFLVASCSCSTTI